MSGRFLRDVALYGFGDFFVRALAFIAVPVYTHLFSPNQYGALSFVTTVAGLLAAALILGGDSAYARFYFETTDDHERGVLTVTWLGFLACWSVLACLLLLPTAGLVSRASLGTSSHAWLFALALFAAPVAMSNRMLAQVFRNQFRPTPFVSFNVASATVGVGLGIVFAWSAHMGLAGIFLGGLIGELAFLGPRLWLLRPVLRHRPDWSRVRPMLAYGAPFVPVSLSYWAFLTADRLILGKISGLDALGLYSLANTVTAILMLVTGAVGQAWTPYALQLYETRPADAGRTFGRFLTYLLAAMGVLCVVFSTFAPEVVRLVAPAKYANAARSVPPLAIALVAYATTQVTALGISLAKRTLFLTRYSFYAAACNIALCFALIPAFGQYGAAWASTAAYTLLTVFYLYRSQKLHPIVIEVKRDVVLIATTVGFSLLAPLLPSNSLPSIGVKALYLLGFTALPFALGVLRLGELRTAGKVIPHA